MTWRQIAMAEKEKVEALEEKVRQLQALLRPTSEFPISWRLSRAESRLLALLAHNGQITNAQAAYAISGTDEVACENSLRVTVYRAREKLYKRGGRIMSKHGVGYYLPPETTAMLKSALSVGLDLES